MIHKFLRVVCAASATWGIKGLVWYADWWKASGLHNIIVHLTSTWAPEILWYARFLHCSALNSQSLWWLIHCSNQCGFITATKTASALLQIRLYHKIRLAPVINYSSQSSIQTMKILSNLYNWSLWSYSPYKPQISVQRSTPSNTHFN